MTELVSHLYEISEHRPTFLAIGSFDGVHLGHQAVLGRMVEAARDAGTRAAVLTFFPHPKRVVLGLTGRYYLTTLAERQRLLAQQGVDLLITHRFDDEVRRTRAAVFVDRLVRQLEMRQLWGGDFALGYQREGDVPFLKEMGREKGFTVEVVEAMVEVDGELVSSSRCRRTLAAGEIEALNACLGRPFRLTGRVVEGAKRGRRIGFPTANLDVWDEQLLPANGVYAARAWLDGRPHAAAANVGVRPTVDGGQITIEAHLLDFSGDLYGRELSLDLLARIRPERKFDGLPQLQAQIARDVAQVRALAKS